MREEGKGRGTGGESGGGKKKVGEDLASPHMHMLLAFVPTHSHCTCPNTSPPAPFKICPVRGPAFPSPPWSLPTAQATLSIASYGQIQLAWASSPSPGVCKEARLLTTHTQWGPMAGLGPWGAVPRVPRVPRACTLESWPHTLLGLNLEGLSEAKLPVAHPRPPRHPVVTPSNSWSQSQAFSRTQAPLGTTGH